MKDSIELPLIEIDRIDWGLYRCGCGQQADHLAKMLKDLISATTDEQASRIELSGHVENESFPSEVAPIAISVMMAALGAELNPVARHKIHLTINWCLNGEEPILIDGIPVLPCEAAAREGIWQLYRDAADGFGVAALVINRIRGERMRLEYFTSRLDPPPEWSKVYNFKSSN